MDSQPCEPSSRPKNNAGASASRRGASIAFALISTALAIGAFVPVLVDGVKNGRLHWSLYSLGGVVMAWLIVAPWFVLRRFRAATSWGAAVIAVPLYLVLVASLGSARAWLLPLGLPVAGLGLAFWGGMVWLWLRSRVPRGYAVALTVFLLGALSFCTHALADAFVQTDPNDAACVLVTWCLFGLSAAIGLIAWLARLLHRRD